MTMGRPGTPGPGEGAGGGGKSGETKATFSGSVVLLGIVSFVLGVIAVATPYWGKVVPNHTSYRQTYSNAYEGTGYFGPFHGVCMYELGGYSSRCGGSDFKTEVYLTVGGVCGMVGVVASGFFCVFSGLHCAMQIQNKQLCFKYKKNAFIALVTAVIAVASTVAAVGISAFQFGVHSKYKVQVGYSYAIEIVLIFLNVLLAILSYMSYKKSRKGCFPRNVNPYEISPYGEVYGNEGYNGEGITVTSGSGRPYDPYPSPVHNNLPASNYRQPPQLSQLPTFPAPHNGHQPYLAPNRNGHAPPPVQVAQPQVPSVSYHKPPSNVGFKPVVGFHPPQQQQQQQAPRPMPPQHGVSMMPEGRGAGGGHHLKGPGQGSMDSLNSTQSSVLSFGSTGSFASSGSIQNPLRSSMKKTKNRDVGSVNSTTSSKKVRIAMGEEQTAV